MKHRRPPPKIQRWFAEDMPGEFLNSQNAELLRSRQKDLIPQSRHKRTISETPASLNNRLSQHLTDSANSLASSLGSQIFPTKQISYTSSFVETLRSNNFEELSHAMNSVINTQRARLQIQNKRKQDIKQKLLEMISGDPKEIPRYSDEIRMTRLSTDTQLGPSGSTITTEPIQITESTVDVNFIPPPDVVPEKNNREVVRRGLEIFMNDDEEMRIEIMELLDSCNETNSFVILLKSFQEFAGLYLRNGSKLQKIVGISGSPHIISSETGNSIYNIRISTGELEKCKQFHDCDVMIMSPKYFNL